MTAPTVATATRHMRSRPLPSPAVATLPKDHSAGSPVSSHSSEDRNVQGGRADPGGGTQYFTNQGQSSPAAFERGGNECDPAEVSEYQISDAREEEENSCPLQAEDNTLKGVAKVLPIKEGVPVLGSVSEPPQSPASAHRAPHSSLPQSPRENRGTEKPDAECSVALGDTSNPCDSNSPEPMDSSGQAPQNVTLTRQAPPRKESASHPPTDDHHRLNPSNPFVSPFYRVVTDGARRMPHLHASADLRRGISSAGLAVFDPLLMYKIPRLGEVSIYTDIGGRKTQEDRFIFCPALGGRDDCLLMGVFDGTVGDFASETVKRLVAPHLVNAPSWKRVSLLLDDETNRPQIESARSSQVWSAQVFPFLADAMDEMFLRADSELVDKCATNGKHYASSTAVTAVIARHCCAIAHLGDSRAMLGHFGRGDIFANFLTDDHKPNQFYEKTRIRNSGGSVEYLHNHNNKPFIRGGDFTLRKTRGEQPMQLQYSRAFGGKDLKAYGLSNEPDILCFNIEPFHCCLVIASDGLWDVLAATDALKVVVNARLQEQDPAKALVQVVLNEQMIRNQTADNITAIVFFFNTPENLNLFESTSFLSGATFLSDQGGGGVPSTPSQFSSTTLELSNDTVAGAPATVEHIGSL